MERKLLISECALATNCRGNTTRTYMLSNDTACRRRRLLLVWLALCAKVLLSSGGDRYIINESWSTRKLDPKICKIKVSFSVLELVSSNISCKIRLSISPPLVLLFPAGNTYADGCENSTSVELLYSSLVLEHVIIARSDTVNAVELSTGSLDNAPLAASMVHIMLCVNAKLYNTLFKPNAIWLYAAIYALAGSPSTKI